jgi:hypothetical protein
VEPSGRMREGRPESRREVDHGGRDGISEGRDRPSLEEMYVCVGGGGGDAPHIKRGGMWSRNREKTSSPPPPSVAYGSIGTAFSQKPTTI